MTDTKTLLDLDALSVINSDGVDRLGDLQRAWRELLVAQHEYFDRLEAAIQVTRAMTGRQITAARVEAVLELRERLAAEQPATVLAENHERSKLN